MMSHRKLAVVEYFDKNVVWKYNLILK